MKKLMIIFAMVGMFASCSNSESYEKIAGKWECYSWINKHHSTNKCNDNVRFEFRLDKEYNSVLGSAIDSGSYKIVSDMLYVTPKGKKEFGVKITKLNRDTLVFLMNRSGEEEVLTLVRTK